VEDRLAAIAAGDPLAVAPHDHRLHQSLMLECAYNITGRRGACLGVARRASAEQGRKQHGKHQPNQRFAHAPLPLDGASTSRVQLDRARFKPQR
jgi:hypothetical protein